MHAMIEHPGQRVLIADDDPGIRRMLAASLEKKGYQTVAARDGSEALEAMRAIGVPVYLLPGNHDPLDASSVYTSALFLAECPDNIRVLDSAGIREVRPGVQLVAAPWRSKAPTRDLLGDAIDDLRRAERLPQSLVVGTLVIEATLAQDVVGVPRGRGRWGRGGELCGCDSHLSLR